MLLVLPATLVLSVLLPWLAGSSVSHCPLWKVQSGLGVPASCSHGIVSPHGNQISSLRCHLFVCVLHQDVNSRRTGTWSVTYTVVPFSQLQLHVIGNWLNKHFADAPLQCVIIHKYQLSFYSCQIHLTFFPTKSMHPWNYCSHGFHLETFEMLQITSSGTPFQKTHAPRQHTDHY